MEDDNGRFHHCSTKRRTGQAICGDYVRWQPSVSGSKLITTIEPRRNELLRSARYGSARIIATNIDQLGIVTACLPEPSWELMDQLLVAARSLPCEAIIIINKSDLGCSTGDLRTISEQYRRIGYVVLHTSTKTHNGIAALKTQLNGKTTILVGQSGVGKSSLIKILLPHRDIRIGELSKTGEKGKHTTSNTILYGLDDGGKLIDSPGVRDFRPTNLTLEELNQGYVEFSSYLGHCRFHNCTHTAEPKCAINDAAQRGEITARRLKSYRKLLSQIAPRGIK